MVDPTRYRSILSWMHYRVVTHLNNDGSTMDTEQCWQDYLAHIQSPLNDGYSMEPQYVKDYLADIVIWWHYCKLTLSPYGTKRY